MRGEYRKHDLQILLIAGSPPLAWGILAAVPVVLNQQGITPTCVGNTPRSNPRRRPRGDHPHLRGEYETNITKPPGISGSPPLAWGIRMLIDLGHCHGRIHPHLRGEYLKARRSRSTRRGSPPLAWGIPEEEIDGVLTHGITPTCVGNTNR